MIVSAFQMRADTDDSIVRRVTQDMQGLYD